MRNRIGIGLMALALAAAPAVSQQASAPSVTGETGLFTLLDGQTLPQGKWSFGIYYNNWDRLVAPIPGGGLLAPLSDDWDYDWNRLSASFGYGITDRFELSVMLPWEDLSASDNNRLGYVNGRLFENRIDGSGIGNVRLGGKYRVFGGPEAERSMAVNAFIELPTGDEEEGIVTGDTGWGLGANWNLGTRWVFGVGYRDPGDADRFDVAQEFTAGVGHVATLNDRFDWITELAATLYQGGDSRPDDAFDLTTGGRYWFGDGKTWAVNFGLRLELAQLSDTDEHCPIGGLLGLTFIPRLAGGPQPPPPPPPPPPVPAVAAVRPVPRPPAPPKPKVAAKPKPKVAAKPKPKKAAKKAKKAIKKVAKKVVKQAKKAKKTARKAARKVVRKAKPVVRKAKKAAKKVARKAKPAARKAKKAVRKVATKARKKPAAKK